MTLLTELSRSYCPGCEEYTYEARINPETGQAECSYCGSEVE